LRADDPRIRDRAVFESRCHAWLCAECDSLPANIEVVPRVETRRAPRVVSQPRWHADAATDKQVKYLTDLVGTPPPAGITKVEARDLISELVDGATPERAHEITSAFQSAESVRMVVWSGWDPDGSHPSPAVPPMGN
jgi:hypothetical protein